MENQTTFAQHLSLRPSRAVGAFPRHMRFVVRSSSIKNPLRWTPMRGSVSTRRAPLGVYSTPIPPWPRSLIPPNACAQTLARCAPAKAAFLAPDRGTHPKELVGHPQTPCCASSCYVYGTDTHANTLCTVQVNVCRCILFPVGYAVILALMPEIAFGVRRLPLSWPSGAHFSFRPLLMKGVTNS